MEQLPVELSIKIISLACFDDQVTGCALCLTSKPIREISNDVRFEALSLYGQTQISGFASMLDHNSQQRVNLKHLFVYGQEIRARAKRGAHALVQVSIADAFATIFRYTGSTLETLFITCMLRPIPLLSHPLPRLRDLSATSIGTMFELGCHFPNLQRIHTTSPLRNWDTSHHIDFAVNAPALEELRLTDLDNDVAWLVSALRCHAWVTDLKPDQEEQLVLPTTMQRVILQQCAPPDDPPHSNAWGQYENLQKMLREVAIFFRESTPKKFGVVLLRELGKGLLASGSSSPGYFLNDTRRDWVDVISGTGKGCWDDQDTIFV